MGNSVELFPGLTDFGHGCLGQPFINVKCVRVGGRPCAHWNDAIDHQSGALGGANDGSAHLIIGFKHLLISQFDDVLGPYCDVVYPFHILAIKVAVGRWNYTILCKKGKPQTRGAVPV